MCFDDRFSNENPEKAITFSEGEILNRFAEPKQIY